ncbi:RelA/SpoT domain-containing protein [Bifidobacterium sp. UMB6791A]|nr:RelA/SpoT domain-containing protein [Bifidobacterium sp. UMB6791B]MDK8249324.1 RelA/SpoT domain-containing protein [Bifidobacterium sp. UMB6794B]MDK8635751.1 RelA/SpoT domain-containing protein [Bifidobacterium sp. UMB6791A]
MTIISRKQATAAGKMLKELSGQQNSEEYGKQILILDSWRHQHEEPAQIFFKKLVGIINKHPDAMATYRLKRKESILKKLYRSNGNFELGAMDDIAGCRVIVNSVSEVYKVYNEILNLKEAKEIDIKKTKDYIKNPEESGYRSLHIIVKQTLTQEDIDRQYRIELQIRTKLQHYWSTAVEAMSEIDNVEYKDPTLISKGNIRIQSCLQFFKVISELFDCCENDDARSKSKEKFVNSVRTNDNFKEIIEDLKAARNSVTINMQKNSAQGGEGLYLLELSRETQELTIHSYTMDCVEKAITNYNSKENSSISNKANKIQYDTEIDSGSVNKDLTVEKPDAQTSYITSINRVLIYAKNKDQLGDTYPNYSYNIEKFIEKVEELIN